MSIEGGRFYIVIGIYGVIEYIFKDMDSSLDIVFFFNLVN